jgi:intron-binding protein aquarius
MLLIPIVLLLLLFAINSWRYDGLGNLDHVLHNAKFQLANPGFVHTFQVIRVDDFEGRGESTPTPYYYQNVGEAEYAVALFQFMVLLGYPPTTISILTTYNGQKDLITDILSKRCGSGTPMAGIRPKVISTVDQYQGQQNDYIILSLVRTKGVGHLRDLRRWIVAVSRARLGLYVVCRPELFAACHDIHPVWEPLMQVEPSSKLQVVLEEHYPNTTRHVTDPPVDDATKRLQVEDVTQLGAIVYALQHEWKTTTTEVK